MFLSGKMDELSREILYPSKGKKKPAAARMEAAVTVSIAHLDSPMHMWILNENGTRYVIIFT